jgi:hypothetical protein
MLPTFIFRTRIFAYSAGTTIPTPVGCRQPLQLPHRKPKTESQKQDYNQCREHRQSRNSRVRIRRRRTNFREPGVRYQRRAGDLLRWLRCTSILRRDSDRWIKSCPRMRRIACQIQIHVRRLVFAQVVKDRHPAPVQVWRHAHDDRRPVRHLLNEFRPARPQRQRIQRRDRSLIELLRIGVGPGSTVADVTGRLHNMFAHSRPWLPHRDLFPLRATNSRQLSQVGNQRIHFGFAQMRKGRHVLPAVMQPVEQHALRLPRQLRCVGPADVHASRLHSLHHRRCRSRPHRVDDRVDFWRRAQPGLAVASAAIHAVQVRSMQSHGFIRRLGRHSHLPASEFRSRHGRWRPQSPRLAHAGFVERPMQMVEPAFSRHRRRPGIPGPIIPACNRLAERRGFEYKTGRHEKRDSPGDDGKEWSRLPHVGVLQTSQLAPGSANVCQPHVVFLSISYTRIRVIISAPAFMAMQTSNFQIQLDLE